MTFNIFRKAIGATTEEIVKNTGYTRQGLYNAFKSIRTEGFKAIIYNYIETKIMDEDARYACRIRELNDLKEEFKPFSIKSRELDQKVHFMKAR